MERLGRTCAEVPTSQTDLIAKAGHGINRLLKEQGWGKKAPAKAPAKKAEPAKLSSRDENKGIKSRRNK